MEDQNHVIILTGVEIAFDKTPHPFMMKTPQQIGYRKNRPQHNKNHTYTQS